MTWRVYERGFIKFVNRRREKVYVPTAVASNGQVRLCRRRFKRARDARDYLCRFIRRLNGRDWSKPAPGLRVRPEGALPVGGKAEPEYAAVEEEA